MYQFHETLFKLPDYRVEPLQPEDIDVLQVFLENSSDYFDERSEQQHLNPRRQSNQYIPF